MDKQPTKARIKEFWERIGFKFQQPLEGGAIDVLYPDGGFCLSSSKTAILPIDPNNLFRYAVPVAIDEIMKKEKCSSDFAYAILFKKWLEKLQLDIPNHEGTLFQTIREVFRNDTG